MKLFLSDRSYFKRFNKSSEALNVCSLCYGFIICISTGQVGIEFLENYHFLDMYNNSGMHRSIQKSTSKYCCSLKHHAYEHFCPACIQIKIIKLLKISILGVKRESKLPLFSVLELSIRECSSTLYVGIAHPPPPTNTNFQLTFLLICLPKALFDDLPV